MKKNKFKYILAIVFILSSIFSHLFFFPRLGYKLQITEIVFLIISIFLLMDFKYFRNRKVRGLDKGVLFLGALFSINLVLHPQVDVAFTVIGSLYLLVVYFAFSTFLLSMDKRDLLSVLKKSADIGFWILVIIGFLGFSLYYFVDYSNFVLVYHNYPYFGDVFRIKGFSYSPHLYISLLTFFTILKLAFSKLSYKHIFIIFTLALMSLTKEALLLIAILFAIFSYKNKVLFKLGIPSVIVAGLLYVSLSFFIISINSDSISLNSKDSSVQTKEPIYQNDYLKIFPTTYFEVFKSGVIMTMENPLRGVGLGNFQKEISNHQKRGIYPKYFQPYQAVDSYFGYAAQLGLFYFVFIFAFILLLMKDARKIPFRIQFPIILFLMYIMFESMALGSFHFRHYYMFFAIFVVIGDRRSEL